jgi:hypothetical protein
MNAFMKGFECKTSPILGSAKVICIVGFLLLMIFAKSIIEIVSG